MSSPGTTPGQDPVPRSSGRPTDQEALLDRIAWGVLTDLFKPDAPFASFSQEGLQHLIGLRLVEEARRSGVPAEALAGAFDRAWEEFSGRNRPPRDPPEDEDGDGDEGPPETVDDL